MHPRRLSRLGEQWRPYYTAKPNYPQRSWVPGAKRPRGISLTVPHGKLLRHACREKYRWRAVGVLTLGRSMRGGHGPGSDGRRLRSGRT